MVVDAQNKVEPREVKIGIEGPNNVEIVSGLKEGERSSSEISAASSQARW